MAELRASAVGDGTRHARTPGIVAELRLAFALFVMYATEAGAFDSTEAGRLKSECWQTLLTAADSQLSHQQASEPAAQFMRLLSAVLASGAGHLADVAGGVPDNPSAWGWQSDHRASVGGSNWQAQGRRVGWIDGADVLLEPDTAFAAVQRLAGEQGETLAVGARTVWKRLNEHGMLASVDQKREILMVRRTIDGNRLSVLHLLKCYLRGEAPTTPTIFQEAGGIVGLGKNCAGRVFESEAQNLPAKPDHFRPDGRVLAPSTTTDSTTTDTQIIGENGPLVGLVGSDYPPVESPEIKHKRAGCMSTEYWTHRQAGPHCAECWPCTDEAYRV